MSEIKLTIDGKEVKGKTGDTLLDICQANGVDVPTLCHYKGLSDVGACRMCMVEVEKERRPVPACTYPARDGLVVRTNTERLEKHRKQVLELLFTERNHFCMFCEASGNCELQKLGYRYQMDNVRYPYAFPTLPVDSVSEYLVLDHNRCIVCGRCIRACIEVAGNHALDFKQRGWQTQVVADLDQPLGESSCLHVGACYQACPTGAIFSKLSSYRGKREECQITETVCPDCGVGCELNVLVKDNNLVKTEAPDMATPRGGLCYMGRFELLKPTPPRITSPLIRNQDGELGECSWDEAVSAIAERLAKANGDFGAVVGTRIPNETLAAFKAFVARAVASQAIDTTDGASARTIEQGIKAFSKNGRGLDIEAPIEEILSADAIMVIGAEPDKTNPVVGTLVRRAVGEKRAKLITINAVHDVFPLRSDVWLKPVAESEGTLVRKLASLIIDRGLASADRVSPEFKKSLGQYNAEEMTRTTGVAGEDLEIAASLFGQAKRGVIIYGDELLAAKDEGLVTTLLNLADMTGEKAGDYLRVISLKRGANSRGAWELGLAKGLNESRPRLVYLFLADEPESAALLRWLRGASFLIAQTSYYSPAVYMADVVLPSAIWSERQGNYTSLDGRTRELKPVLKPANEANDETIFSQIARKMAKA